MLILDDILLSPLNGFVWVAKKLYEAAEQELASEEQGITRELNEIYMMLETNQMSDQEFDLREAVLAAGKDRQAFLGQSPVKAAGNFKAHVQAEAKSAIRIEKFTVHRFFPVFPPVGTVIRGSGPISTVPLVAASVWIPIPIHPRVACARTSRVHAYDPRLRRWPDPDADRELPEQARSSHQEQRSQH